MTTYVAFAWGFGTGATGTVVLLLAWLRRRKPATIVFEKPGGILTVPGPLTTEQFDRIAADWAAACVAPHAAQWIRP